MNLLPEEEKELIKKGFKLRFLVVTCVFLSLSFLLGTLLFLPTYVLTKDRLKIIALTNSIVKYDDEELVKEMLKIPKEVEFKLKILESSLKSKTVSEIMYAITSGIPGNIKIENISLNRKGEAPKEQITITISGIATDRQSLVKFEDVLKESGYFKSVEIPVSSFTKEKDLPFSINILFLNEKLDS